MRENRKLLPLQKLELQFNLPPISALQATDNRKGGINFVFFKNFEIVAEHPENKLECLFSKNQLGVGLSQPDEAGTGQT